MSNLGHKASGSEQGTARSLKYSSGTRRPLKALFFLALVSCQNVFGAGDTTVLATGDWSEPVADSIGYAIRGRIVIAEMPVHRGTSPGYDTAVYLELQECSNFHGATLEVFVDMPTNTFLDVENKIHLKTGCEWELVDSANKPVPNSPGGFIGGGEPGGDWILMPCDTTVRLRASAYNGGRQHGSPFVLDLPYHHYWVILPQSTNKFFLSATFTADPPSKLVLSSNHVLWRGKLSLPKLRIPVEKL